MVLLAGRHDERSRDVLRHCRDLIPLADLAGSTKRTVDRVGDLAGVGVLQRDDLDRRAHHTLPVDRLQEFQYLLVVGFRGGDEQGVAVGVRCDRHGHVAGLHALDAGLAGSAPLVAEVFHDRRRRLIRLGVLQRDLFFLQLLSRRRRELLQLVDHVPFDCLELLRRRPYHQHVRGGLADRIRRINARLVSLAVQLVDHAGHGASVRLRQGEDLRDDLGRVARGLIDLVQHTLDKHERRRPAHHDDRVRPRVRRCGEHIQLHVRPGPRNLHQLLHHRPHLIDDFCGESVLELEDPDLELRRRHVEVLGQRLNLLSDVGRSGDQQRPAGVITRDPHLELHALALLAERLLELGRDHLRIAMDELDLPRGHTDLRQLIQFLDLLGDLFA